MTDIKWIKITTDIFDDEKILFIEELPEADSIIVIWFKLLCLAGKQNNAGVFMFNDRIPYTEKMLATIFRRKESTVHLALETFEQFGMIEVVNGAVTIPNWEKHQNIDGMEKIREQNRQRVARHREKQKLLAAGKAEEDVTLHEPLQVPLPVMLGNGIDKEKEKEKEKDKIKNTIKGLTAAEQDALNAFIEMRKTIKKPMTDRAVTILVNKLMELGKTEAERVAILNQSIEHCWQTVYPLKDEKGSTTGKPGGKKNDFHNFKQHDYDWDAIEKALFDQDREDVERMKRGEPQLQGGI